MKIKKSRIEEIIKEELTNHIGGLLGERTNEAPKTVAADKDNDDKEPDVDSMSKNIAPTVGDKKDGEPAEGDQEEPEDKPTDAGDEEGDQEIPAGDDPADDQISKDVEEPEPDSEKDIAGDISDGLVGKQIQSITMEPNSKMMPGAKELTIQVENHPWPLKILLGKSGMIKFFYRGSLHNEL